MKKIIALLLVLCSFSAFIFAEDIYMPALTLGSTRSNGLGGPHVAYTDDIYSLFVNPGALLWSNQGSILEISAALTGPLDELIKKENIEMLKNTISSFSDDSSDLGSSLSGLSAIMPDGKLPLGVNLRGPLSIGYTANGLGLGLFSNVSVDARVIGTNLKAKVYGDVMFNFGMALNVLHLKNHEISAGFVLKPFARVMGDLGLNAATLAGGDAMDALLDGVAIPLIVGGGVDLGLQYRLGKGLVLGFAVNDIYTVGFNVYDVYGTSVDPDALYRVKPAYNVGLSYTFKVSNVWESAPKSLQSFYIAAMADWHNVQNVFSWDDFEHHRNPILDFSAGAELGLFNFLKFRVGLNEMLPSVGFGFEPGFFKLNFALYGKELGNEPGQLTTMAAEFSLAFRPNTKKKSFGFAQPIIK